MKFGEFLIEQKLIAEATLGEALAVQSISHERLGRVLVQLDYLTQEACNSALETFLEVKPKPNFLKIVAESGQRLERFDFGGRLGFVLWGVDPVLAMEEFDDRIVELVERSETRFEMVSLSPAQAETMFEICQSRAERTASSPHSLQEKSKQKRAFSTPYSSLLISLLREAKERRASDVHFDSNSSGLSIRFRIDGDLVEVKSVKSDHVQPLLSEVKRTTGLPLTVIGIPTGGSAKIDEIGLKVRAQSNGQIYGETIVLRLIDEEKMSGACLERIGVDEDLLGQLKSAVNSHCGLILICGPTGSGKSWTLYSALMSLDRKKMKVITIEDPVEYEGEGLTQIEVTDKKFGFAEALKSCLRLDPDVLMIGEIRDEETAELAFKAASTGHLVFSTLHTNGALEAIERLRGLGIADDLIISNIRLVLAQALRKRLCPACREKLNGADKLTAEAQGLCSGKTLFQRHIGGCDGSGCVDGAVGMALLAEAVDQKMIRTKIESGKRPKYRTIAGHSQKLAANGIIAAEDVLYA